MCVKVLVICVRSSVRADSVHSSSPSASSSRSPSRSSPLRPPATYKPPSSQPVTTSAHMTPSSSHQDVMSAGDWLQTPVTASSHRAYKPTGNQQDVKSASNSPLNVLSPGRPGDMSAYRRLAAGTGKTLPAGMLTTSQPDVVLATNTQTNVHSLRQFCDVSARSRPPNMSASSHLGATSAGSRLQSVVPLQANFQKPRDIPRGSKMNAVTTHIDDQCHIFVHRLNNGLYVTLSYGVIRILPLRFLVGCRRNPLNRGFVVLCLSCFLGFISLRLTCTSDFVSSFLVVNTGGCQLSGKTSLQNDLCRVVGDV